VSRPRKIAPSLRSAALGICIVFLVAIVLVQIEQHVLRRRAERLLTDIRSLEIHRSTSRDVQNLGRKWKNLAHFEGNCTEAACILEISWTDFYLRHIDFFVRLNALHFFMLAGGRPEQITARATVEKGLVSGKSFHVVVGVPAYRAPEGWWPDYALLADAYSVSGFSESRYRPPPAHPDYLVGKPGGCDGPCREVHFIFSASADSATVNRLMEIDLSCLTRWIHTCRTEGDIMPSAWAQYELDYGLQ
jgi:hypothetical protein